MSAADEAVEAADEAAEAAVSRAAEARALIALPRARGGRARRLVDVRCPCVVSPMILSFIFVIAARVRRTRRSTIRGGLSFSVSALTSALSSRWVWSISLRI